MAAGIQFSFTVWSCLRPLWGFGLELIELVNEGALEFDKDDVRKILDDARQWASKSLRTDAQFLYTPPQIALSCIFHFNVELVRRFLSIKFPPGRILSRPHLTQTIEDTTQEDAAHKLMDIIITCDTLISDRLKVVDARSKEEVTAIDKKLWQCRKLLDSVESTLDTAKRKSASPDGRQVKKARVE